MTSRPSWPVAPVTAMVMADSPGLAVRASIKDTLSCLAHMRERKYGETGPV
jgi:hypothetical protein